MRLRHHQRVAEASVEALGQVPGDLEVLTLGLSGRVKAQINQQLRAEASSFQLPMGVRLDSVSVTGAGLQVSASASGVQVPATR